MPVRNVCVPVQISVKVGGGPPASVADEPAPPLELNAEDVSFELPPGPDVSLESELSLDPELTDRLDEAWLAEDTLLADEDVSPPVVETMPEDEVVSPELDEPLLDDVAVSPDEEVVLTELLEPVPAPVPDAVEVWPPDELVVPEPKLVDIVDPVATVSLELEPVVDPAMVVAERVAVVLAVVAAPVLVPPETRLMPVLARELVDAVAPDVNVASSPASSPKPVAPLLPQPTAKAIATLPTVLDIRMAIVSPRPIAPVRLKMNRTGIRLESATHKARQTCDVWATWDCEVTRPRRE